MKRLIVLVVLLAFVPTPALSRGHCAPDLETAATWPSFYLAPSDTRGERP